LYNYFCFRCTLISPHIFYIRKECTIICITTNKLRLFIKCLKEVSNYIGCYFCTTKVLSSISII
jgi:hypothetical protein